MTSPLRGDNMPAMQSSQHQVDETPSAIWLAMLALAVVAYVFGLGGQYIPSNGDEMVYAHIARATAETGQWLPLASELPDTRNTKPPLLFWQAMVAGNWGQHWSLAALRAPSVIYTLLTAAAIAACVRLVTRRWPQALLAACLYLAFFSTFRYGRPYLTSAPETFWFSLPLFGLVWQRARSASSGPGLGLHFLVGLGLGLGLAYKSFALIAPATAAWWLALVLSDTQRGWRALLVPTLRTAFSAVLALGVFALWFVLDPDPAAVWREFIVGENAAKFSDARGYWHEALAPGGSSIWSQLLAYAVNAGLLFFVVIGLGWLGLKQMPQLRAIIRHRSLPPHLAILLAWSLVWLLVFLFPSQRSARYVIPAMPAVAMLLALYWRDIGRLWFMPTLLFCALAFVMLGRIAWVGRGLGLSSTSELGLTLLVMAIGTLAIVAGLWRSAWTRTASLLACLLVYAGFGLTVAPLDGMPGNFGPAAVQQLPAGRVAAPNNFNGQFERYRFVLPGSHRFVPYDTDARALARVQPGSTPPTPAAQLERLLADHAAVIWGQSSQEEIAPACLPACRVLGERWHLRSRYLSGEISLSNVWYPQQWLFRHEWLVVRAAPR
jgi:4-amino-4-deoxy-L-arabinose transferase-like glycosyltransferase